MVEVQFELVREKPPEAVLFKHGSYLVLPGIVSVFAYFLPAY
jgi:hypothetical protein